MSELVSVCAWCPGQREKTLALEAAGKQVTHGICQDCVISHFGIYADRVTGKQDKRKKRRRSNAAGDRKRSREHADLITLGVLSPRREADEREGPPRQKAGFLAYQGKGDALG